MRVFDDYAHHPTEVRAVLSAGREIVASDGGRLIAVFQPHLYSRTRIFAEEFGRALSLADEVVVLDVYGAREQPEEGVDGGLVTRHVSSPAHHVPDLDTALSTVLGSSGRTTWSSRSGPETSPRSARGSSPGPRGAGRGHDEADAVKGAQR